MLTICLFPRYDKVNKFIVLKGSLNMNEQILESYLTRYGWEWFISYTGEAKIWCTGWQSEIKSFPLNISFTDTWILFEVNPFIPLEYETQKDELYKALMELNNDIQLVKLSINESSNISLKLQLFSNMSFEDFSNALGVLAYYADLLYANLVDTKEDIPSSLETYSMIF